MTNLSDSTLAFCDWSGVISDDRRIVYEANARMIKRYGLKPISYEQWLGTVTASVREWFEEAGIKASAEELYSLYEKSFQENLDEGMAPTIYPDASAFLAHVSATRPVAIISAHPEQFLRAEGDGYNVSQYIETYVGSSRNKVDAMQKILTEKGLSGKEAFLVGDTLYDIRAAKEAGVFSVGITTGYHPREKLAAESPDALVDSLTELAELLS